MSRHAHLFSDVKRDRDAMHPYQSDIALPHVRDNPFSALFVDMGLGKTVTMATLIADLLAEFDPEQEQVLIVGPMKVALDTWPTEFRLWGHLAHLRVNVIHSFDDEPEVIQAKALARIKARADAQFFELPKGDAQRFVQFAIQKAETKAKNALRAARAKTRCGINVVSRDWVEWLVNLHGPKWPYRIVVIDEISGFKDHASGRFKALAKVRRTPGLIKRLHGLTATPAAETYEHLFAQVYLMDLGERLGKNITTYRNKYFTYNKWSMKWKLRPDAEEEITKKISDICLVMNAKDFLKDYPVPTIIPRKVKLSAEQMALYQQMQENNVVALPGGAEVVAENAAILSAKLLQMASGVLYDTRWEEDWDTDDFKRITRVHHLHDEKINELRLLREEAQGAPLLVAYHFKSSLARLKKAFPDAVVMDEAGKIIKKWNAGKVPMLLVHPASAGHGLNLQYGSNYLVFFDTPWSLELYLQTIGRLARQGQTKPVFVYLLQAIGTLDEDVANALATKKDAQDVLFRLIKQWARQKHKAAVK
jgi:SNF2 family DNA or RNA helicase